MNRKLISLILVLTLALCILSGCDTVGEIAGNVADAAMKELENQVRAVMEEYKMDVIELKTTAGKLNSGSGDLQIFCAVLVRSDNDAVPQTCADTLAKVFPQSGVTVQTAAAIESPYLTEKELSYSFTGFGNGDTYYTIYVYTALDAGELLNRENS